MTLATKADFLEAIAAHPDDDTPRLIYADWLEEHGNDPERAEFIRVQCRLPIVVESLEPSHHFISGQARFCRSPKCEPCRLRRREKKLLKHWFCEWNSEFYGAIAEAEVKEALATGRSLRRDPLSPPRTCEFRRGFIFRVSLSHADFLQYAADIIESVPMLEEVRLSDVGPIEMRFDDGSTIWAFSRRFVWPAAFDDAVNLAYGNRDHALAAMSHCCLTFAREQLAKRRSLTPSSAKAKRLARSDR